MAEDGTLVVRRQSVDMTGLLLELRERFEGAALTRNVSISEVGERGLAVSIDRKLIERLLENLVGNALRYTPAGGQIEIGLAKRGTDVVLTVANDGEPMAPEVRRRLFQKYGTGEDARQSSNRGLGLYFCRLAAEAHGGAIRARDRDGGTCFEVLIPQAGDGGHVEVGAGRQSLTARSSWSCSVAPSA